MKPARIHFLFLGPKWDPSAPASKNDAPMTWKMWIHDQANLTTRPTRRFLGRFWSEQKGRPTNRDMMGFSWIFSSLVGLNGISWNIQTRNVWANAMNINGIHNQHMKCWDVGWCGAKKGSLATKDLEGFLTAKSAIPYLCFIVCA